MMLNSMFYKLIAGLISAVFYNEAQAVCTKNLVGQTSDYRAAKIVFGKTNLPSTQLLPAGSVLDSVTVPPTAYTSTGANGDTPLWFCDLTDLDKVYFLVATNGDDRHGGFWDLGGADGLQDVYGTYFANVGLHQSMDGVPLTRYWKKIPLKDYVVFGDGFWIRLKDLPTLQATTYRISSQPPAQGAPNANCGTDALPTTGSYTCDEASAFIQLSGNSDVIMEFEHDMVGEDSAYHHKFRLVQNGFGYGLNTTANTLTRTPTCSINQVNPLHYLPTISPQALNDGLKASVQVPIRVECQNLMKSGTAEGQVALGFQANAHAYQVVSDLDFVNSAGGAQYIVSDDYGLDDSLASGVGLELSNPEGNKSMVFLSPNATVGGGENQGWYPVLEGQTSPHNESEDHFQVNKMYDVNLVKLPGQTATAGKVKATINVQVKLQ